MAWRLVPDGLKDLFLLAMLAQGARQRQHGAAILAEGTDQILTLLQLDSLLSMTVEILNVRVPVMVVGAMLEYLDRLGQLFQQRRVNPAGDAAMDARLGRLLPRILFELALFLTIVEQEADKRGVLGVALRESPRPRLSVNWLLKT